MVADDDELEFYPCLVDGAPASIYVNLRFDNAPPANHETRYTVAILMREHGEHGIGTADEAAALNLLEEALMARAFGLGLTYVGRLRTRGIWEVTFYGPRGHLAAMRARAIERAEERRVATIMNPEPAWTYYREILLPDAERRQWMDDRRMVQILGEQGDRLSPPRRVDHRLSFPDVAARDAFIAAVTLAGFTLDGGDGDLGVRVHRMDPIELDHIHDVVMILVDAATPLGGRYERWEAAIMR
ncbi:MAG: DUF695 domain-containing protein [Myxococcota bacterium]|nr:DUF695 domain-containing protein [Deltaproteobacteria bacterium]MDQ3338336.1 DUF695 domain-containing protein [Myxococcota bacterium]